MVVKKALIKEEFDRLRLFLDAYDLKYDEKITESLYVEADGRIIATASRYGNLIEAVAVSREHRGENLAVSLISELLASMRKEGIFYYQVYTKAEYLPVFESMGFRFVEKTEKVAILEGGEGDIETEIGKIKKRVEGKYRIKLNKTDVGAIVVNCNPMTKGHFQLIVEAAAKHEIFLVFVVEEERSFFTYPERMKLVKAALSGFPNIMVLPSTKYVVSSLTFPSYFLKSIDEAEKEHAKLDAMIFRDYFMRILNIRKRYIGSETEPVMTTYNDLLKKYLKESLVLRERFKYHKDVISASKVRQLITEGHITEASELVPENIKDMFMEMAKKKYEKRI